MNDYHFTVIDPDQIQAAELVLPCTDLSKALDFYTKDLGFRIDLIFPADAPRIPTHYFYKCRSY